MSLEIRRAADRFTTRSAGIVSRHSFSFGAHYDPAHTAFGRLVACNEEELAAGAGFGEHPHAGLDIVTWVLEGALAHEDSTGARSVLRPGAVQWLRAGTGVRHAEVNAAAGPTRFVQLWLSSDEPAAAPSYEQHDVRSQLVAGRLVPVLRIGPRAELHVGRLEPGTRALLPDAERVHVVVTRGAAELGGAAVGAGDSVRLAGHSAEVSATRPAEVLVVTQSGA